MPSIALLTCACLPEPDHDANVHIEAFERAGAQAQWVAWDEPFPNEAFSTVVVRSPWNYHLLCDEFLCFLDQLASSVPVINHPEIIRWNANKRYLLELETKGFPIVPTQILSRQEGSRVLEVARSFGSESVVLKPTVSGGSYLTFKCDSNHADDLMAKADEVFAHSELMIQPFLSSVNEGGEVSWIWIDGEITHGVRKYPRFAGSDESVSPAISPNDQIRDYVNRLLAPLSPMPMYARIDLIRLDSGEEVLSELELIEPSLFFAQFPSAADSFAQAICKFADTV